MKNTIIVLIFIILSSACRAEIPKEVLSKINSNNADERMDACLLLGGLGNPEAIPLLKGELKDTSMLVRHSAANALARIGGDEVNNIFKEMISSSNSEKKRIGLAGLAMTGDPGSIELVQKQLDDPDWQVRWSAIYALGQWGYRPAIPKLTEIAQNDQHKDNTTGEYPIRKMAEEVAKKIKCSIEWYRSLNDARILSEKLQKPIWIYWMITENLLCDKMEEVILFSPEISDISQNFVCVRLDAQKDPGPVSQYDVNAVPSIIILDKSGNEVDRLTGLISRDGLISRLKKVLENKGTPKEWKEFLAKNPEDIESSWFLAEWYLDNNKAKDAIPLLESIIKHDPKNKSGYTDNAIFVLGFSLGSIGEYKKSISFLERLRKEYPNFKDMDKALYCLGLDYLSVNKKALAKNVFMELIGIYPESKTVKPAKEILEKL